MISDGAQLENRSFQPGFLLSFKFLTSFKQYLRKLKFCGKKIVGNFCVRDSENATQVADFTLSKFRVAAQLFIQSDRRNANFLGNITLSQPLGTNASKQISVIHSYHLLANTLPLAFSKVNTFSKVF